MAQAEPTFEDATDDDGAEPALEVDAQAAGQKTADSMTGIFPDSLH